MNGYNFDFAVSAKISEQVVKEMITKIVEEQTGRKVEDITFNTREESDYMDRYSRTVFAGCTVTFASETGKRLSSNNSQFGDH